MPSAVRGVSAVGTGQGHPALPGTRGAKRKARSRPSSPAFGRPRPATPPFGPWLLGLCEKPFLWLRTPSALKCHGPRLRRCGRVLRGERGLLERGGPCAPSDLCPQLQERRLPRGLTPFMRPLWSPRPPLFFRSIREKLGAEAATPAARTPPTPRPRPRRHAASPGPRRTLSAKRLPSQCFPVHMPSLGPWEDIIKNSR